SLKYGNFTVLEEPGIYRISHGVLTRNQYAARLSRLETVVVRATLWQRRIGRCNLSIGTAGTFGEQGILAPVAMMLDEKVLPQRIESVCPPCRIEEDRWQPLPKRYRWTLVARWAMTTVVLMIPVAATVLQAYRHGGSPFMHAMLFIVPAGTLAMFASSLLGTIRAGYAVGEDVVASRYGFFTQTTSVMPLERIEVAMESQPPFWRRHGLVALDVKGMTHQVAFPMLPKEVSDAIVERVAERSRARQDAKRQATEEGPGGSGMPSLPPSFPSYRAASIPAEHPSSDSGSSIG
ncbi:MAG TPA: PH domain-containing protein, partial [Fimbriimonas sp.]